MDQYEMVKFVSDLDRQLLELEESQREVEKWQRKMRQTVKEMKAIRDNIKADVVAICQLQSKLN